MTQKLSTFCIKTLCETIVDAVENIYIDNPKEDTIGVDCRWTQYGILIMEGPCPKYFFHNNGLSFIFKKGSSDPSQLLVGIRDKVAVKDDWMLGFLEMAHGILVRSITPVEEVPKHTKLLAMAEERLETIFDLKEGTIKWITC